MEDSGDRIVIPPGRSDETGVDREIQEKPPFKPLHHVVIPDTGKSESFIDVAREKADRLTELATQDPVGNLFIATAIVAAHLDMYPLACGAFVGGIYHIESIDKIQRRKEQLLKRAKDHPDRLKQLDEIHERLESGSLSDKYTAWLYRNLREKVVNEVAKKQA
jgi:hypothetical protein